MIKLQQECSATLPTAQYEAELVGFMDFADGQQKLSSTCISRLRIPESVHSNAALAETLSGTLPLPPGCLLTGAAFMEACLWQLEAAR